MAGTPPATRGNRTFGRAAGNRTFGRAAGLVFVLLVALAIMTAVRTEWSIEAVRSATDDANKYGPAVGLLTLQETLVHLYAERPTEMGKRFEKVDVRLDTLMTQLKKGDGTDGEEIARAEMRYYHSVHRYFSAVDSGRLGLAARIDKKQVDPSYEQARALADSGAQGRAAEASDTLSTLESRQERILVVLPLLFLFGGTALFLLLRKSRRIQVQHAEAEAEISQLERAVLTDSLTELPNHRAFYEDVDAELETQRERRDPLCLVMFDSNGLKGINEQLGHQVGDQMLRGLAGQIRDVVGDAGRAYRVGSDVFAVMLPHQGALEGAAVADSLRERLSTDDDSMNVTAGIAESYGSLSRTELIRRTDLAMIHAKRTNRHLVIYSPDVEQQSSPGTRQQKLPRQALASALARAVDAKDSYTRSHSDTVASICVLLAEKLNLPSKRVGRLRLAGLLHDVGKIGTPDEILQKPSKLTAEEYEVVKQHPVKGAEIARAAVLEEESQWILHHHERLDGHGYPDGLEGDEIPLESRIILVADAYEALTSDRPYRLGRPSADALEEIEENAGTQFDPNVVAALAAILAHTDLSESATRTLKPPAEPALAEGPKLPGARQPAAALAT